MTEPTKTPVKLEGVTPAQYRKYRKAKLESITQIFRHALSRNQGVSTLRLLESCADGFPELSPALRWKDATINTLTLIHHLETILWAVTPADPAHPCAPVTIV